MTGTPRAALTIDELFARQAAARPRAAAVRGDDGAFSYAELDAYASRLARHLTARGVRPGDTVGIHTRRSAAGIGALLAIVRCGAAYVALDHRYPARRRVTILNDARVRLVVTDQHSALGVPDGYRVVVLDADAAAISACSPASLPSACSPDTVAYVAYTSGSTGTPKGVCVPHRAVVRLVHDGDVAPIRADDVFLQFAPIAFDASTWEIWGALANGAALVVAPARDPSVVELVAFARAQRVTALWLSAGLFRLVAESSLDGLAGLRHLVAGGDVLSPVHVRRAVRALPATVVVNGYGPTENTTFTCCHRITTAAPDGPVPIGRPIRGTTVYLLDDELRPVADGETGELYAAGAGLALGYLGHGGFTAGRFVADPFAAQAGSRMYRTGDLARRRPDGTIEFVRRADSQVKVNGFRVEPGEVEAAALALPGVGAAAVVAQPVPGGGRRLIAYLVAAPGARLSSVTVRRALREALAGYAVPALVRVVDGLPLSANGKVDRAALSARPAGRPDVSAPFRSPAGRAETEMVQLWSDQLGIAGVGADDDFFELGGDSLLAVTIIEELAQGLGAEVSPLELYLNPTPGGLAATLAEEQAAGGGDDGGRQSRTSRG